MAVWQWQKDRFKSVDVKDKFAGMDGYLCCPGPSLANVKDADLHVPGGVVFAINTAYPHIRPDVWAGLDWPECYDRSLWDQPFAKMCRGNYHDVLCAGVPIKRSPNTYFLDTVGTPKGKPYSFITERSDKFTWHKNTLIWAIDIMVFMGIKRIHFIGCDMGGAKDYYDNRELSKEHHDINRKLYASQVESLKALVPMLGKIGVYCISCTPDSPLNNVMASRDLAACLRETSKRTFTLPPRPVATVDSARDKICIITPTRGDRPDFIEQWRGMLKRQIRQPDKVYLMDYAPESDKKDQRERVLRGVHQALADGFRRALIIEDDDYYREDYIDTMMELWRPEIPLIGSAFYSIYHLGERARITYTAEGLASGNGGIVGSPLSCTGFDLEMFLRFAESGWMGKHLNLDLDLWHWAQVHNIPRKLVEIPNMVISMKHGIGMVAGGCHTTMKDRRGAKMDSSGQWLRDHVHEDCWGFYDAIGGKVEQDRIVIYTAIIGDIDAELPSVTNVPDNVDLKCFTDRDLQSDVWEIVQVPAGDNPRRESRKYKMAPHTLLPGYDYSVWIDGNGVLDASDILAYTKRELGDSVFATINAADMRNSSFDCLYEYVDALIANNHPRIGDAEAFRAQVERYRLQGLPPKCGVAGAGFMLRKHNDAGCKAVMENWIYEYQTGESERDMLSLTKVLHDAPHEFYRYIPKRHWWGRFGTKQHAKYNG